MTRPKPRLPAALIAPRRLIVGALAWGLAMAISLLASVLVLGRDMGSHNGALAMLYAAGGFLGWLIALPLIHVITRSRAPSVVLSAWLLILGLSTLAATAALFAVHYRIFYAHWHAPAFTRVWIYQQIFTGASAAYQFAVTGLRHFLPVGLLLLFGLGVAMARRSR
ncbi:hypothetical protein [Peteryoungia ipomoeae]|uniref:Uncharacterized protein n=1 Tax=Peteryoungia ipomoeae TaxID=1210932 RepID=A0A4S8P6T0_9HYPH|nr:hypothetical protein [Peteryoungia ipomoeae]THV25015.1 hypothetical protein FAA97_02060 [Peteryoungia ipomoeae]